MSLIGWALGIQKDSESPTKQLLIAPSVPILGASTMQRTSQGPPSLTVAAPAEGTMIADADLDHSVSSSLDPSGISGMDITSAPLMAVPIPVESRAVRIDSSCVIHPFMLSITVSLY